jgi:nucleolar protein 58
VPFTNAVTALNEAAALTDGKVSSMLSTLLEELKDETKASLAVADPKLANSIAQVPGLSLKLISDSSSTQDVYRAIREHLSSILPDLLPAEMASTQLGLSHSLSRHKLKFNSAKGKRRYELHMRHTLTLVVDTMIIQVCGLTFLSR